MVIELILMIATFLFTNWIAWLTTEKYKLPKFLQYKPFQCRICQAFWVTIFAAICFVLVLGYKVTAIGLTILAILNAIAMYIDQRNKTIKDINTYKIEEDV